MFRSWLVVTALLIAIYCIFMYIRNVVVCRKTEYGALSPGTSLLFLVRNQQDIIEGLIRKALSEACCQPVEVVAVDLGSVDQTRLIMERLAGDYQNFRFLTSSEESGVSKKVNRLCRGETIYCFDLSGPINYSLMSRTIHSVLNGSGASLYRTRVLYKNETPGRCKHRCNLIK